MTAFRLGLTGGLASGKSTVARWMAEAGFTVIDADEAVAQLYQSGGAGAVAVRELFGDGALGNDGSVSHEALAERVFEDPEALAKLEAAVHPLVRTYFANVVREAEDVAVLEATLLVEAGYAPDFDLVVTVEADPETQLARAIERGLDRADAEARLRAQGDGSIRRAAAHVVIENDGDRSELRTRVDEVIEEVDRLRAEW